MLLLGKKISKPGSKNRIWWSLKLQPKVNIPKLSTDLNNSGGRGGSGLKTVRTKSYTRRRRFAPLFNISSGIYSLLLIVTAQKIGLRSRIIYLLRSALGFWSFIPAFKGAMSLSYVQAQLPQVKSTGLNPYQTYIPWWFKISKITPFSKISWVSLSSDIFYRYARSLGSSCKLIIPEVTNLWSLIMLPSGRLTFVDKDIYVFLGSAEPLEGSKAPLANAGSRRRLGFKPTVRGVAKNPNDHPHGGRASSIRYPRTPWGKTAKYPRKAGLVFKFKKLAKRRSSSTKSHTQPYWINAV